MVARLVIAAPSSGSGKTTVATGLMAALRRRGGRVAPFKVGPDYIDPGYHTLAAGRPGRNLDPVLVGEERIAPLCRHGSHGADIAVIEGVMGLFDGRIGTDGFGSTAHVASLLQAPVVLVVDGRGQGRSLAALLHGFRSYDATVRLAGVILNQVGSERHEQVLTEACDEIGLDVLGVVRRSQGLEVPSRHLGLVTAAEHGSVAVQAVEAMADSVAAGVDLDEVSALAATAPSLTAQPWSPDVDPVSARPVVAVAGGSAFTFGYAEHVELLKAAGAQVAVVDPLRDKELPDGTAGLVLPGGFPEQHAAELSANDSLRREVAELAASGAPVHAECGGLLYLARELDGLPMCGVLPAVAAMTSRLTLGYRDALAPVESTLHSIGDRVTGHEFHRTAVTPRHGDQPAWRWRDAEPEGFVHGGVHASYLHTHPAGAPQAIRRFVERCTK
ncbi:cobyrinate a,c-diamide synthase [Kutzneria buriramensis]|uniref:Hydrogenobyrinate a,c-diamide synthase n=1 Tax=Kutzneria buriramensis TaxID=1045776 RepID=A0A3E0I110_9PSEU|nr:cobyrinate a,c-diamide synthase [Kutzneria buriramensis]REH52226.1 cobyrinic acid a,c-diamide synthase [Kutzneria buriramensis]